MGKKKVDKHIEERVLSLYTLNTPQQHIALEVGVSPRTVGRILWEKGIQTPVRKEQELGKQCLAILKKHNISVEDLDAILSNKENVITAKAVQKFLNKSSSAQLARMFYASGLVKITEIFQEQQKQNKEKEHAE